jgi:hypothetical protein
LGLAHIHMVLHLKSSYANMRVDHIGNKSRG